MTAISGYRAVALFNRQSRTAVNLNTGESAAALRLCIVIARIYGATIDPRIEIVCSAECHLDFRIVGNQKRADLRFVVPSEFLRNSPKPLNLFSAFRIIGISAVHCHAFKQKCDIRRSDNRNRENAVFDDDIFPVVRRIDQHSAGRKGFESRLRRGGKQKTERNCKHRCRNHAERQRARDLFPKSRFHISHLLSFFRLSTAQGLPIEDAKGDLCLRVHD